MGLFNNFPWTNFHELNLDWIIKQIKEIQAAFPEGLVGILKGGTGADNAADARANLGIYASEIDMSPDDSRTISLVMGYLDEQIEATAESIDYRIFKTVESLGLTPGSVSISSAWVAMSPGDVILCPPDEFATSACPESYGTLLLIRSGGNSGACLFLGANHQYRMNFINNYPSGVWKQLYTDADIVPISNGGTGADNAADAIRNLGIDFSGTVLSVANVGADPTGNVPLKISNLIPVDITTLGLPSNSTVSAVRAVMPSNSALSAPASQFSNPPISEKGIIIITKQGSTDELGFIRYISQSGKIFDMSLTSAGLPTGIWNPHNKSLNLNFTAWTSAFLWRTDSSSVYVYLPAGSLYNGNAYSSTDQSHGYTFMATGASVGIPISNIGLPSAITRSGQEMLTLTYPKPQELPATGYGICSPRQNINISTSI